VFFVAQTLLSAFRLWQQLSKGIATIRQVQQQNATTQHGRIEEAFDPQ
jgi:hypothetical protein